MSLVVRAFPVTRSLEDVDGFIAGLKERRGEAAAFYRAHGVSHESWHVQETPAGPWVIVVNLVDDPAEAAPRYARSTEDFETWFKNKVLDVTGVDPAMQPLGPETRLVYEWSDEKRGEVAAAMAGTVAA